jgi:hypothetical protein
VAGKPTSCSQFWMSLLVPGWMPKPTTKRWPWFFEVGLPGGRVDHLLRHRPVLGSEDEANRLAPVPLDLGFGVQVDRLGGTPDVLQGDGLVARSSLGHGAPPLWVAKGRRLRRF